MASTLLLLVSALVLTASVFAAKEHDKHEHSAKKYPTCQDFTQGQTFDDSQALGTWRLLEYGFKSQTNGPKDAKCVEFSMATDQERKELSDKIGKYVENLNWDNLTLKMQIPCIEILPNVSRDFFLEKLDSDGSYRTLQMPPRRVKLDLARFNRYPMRLKVIEGQYLGMMDCHEKFVFLLAKKEPQDPDAEARLKKMMKTYWPDEN